MSFERKIEELGLVLPKPFQNPSGKQYPFRWVRVHQNRAVIAGHMPLDSDGKLAQPLGKVGSDLTLAQGCEAARKAGLAILASLRQELGSLDRIDSWLRVFGMVNVAPGFIQTPAVVNAFSDLILAVFGPEQGAHARSAVGMAELPFGVAIEIEGEVALR